MTLRHRRAGRAAAVMLGSLSLVFALASPAFAQVPELPDTPEAPEEVTDAIGQAQSTIVPVLTDAAIAGQPAANGVGFALRPICAGTGSAIVVASLLGATLPLPVSPGLVLVPAFIMCGAAFDEGPADPVFEQVDGAAGPAVEDTSQPVMDQAATAMAPVRPTLSEGCSIASLFSGAPKYAPAPLNRLDLLGVICG